MFILRCMGKAPLVGRHVHSMAPTTWLGWSPDNVCAAHLSNAEVISRMRRCQHLRMRLGGQPPPRPDVPIHTHRGGKSDPHCLQGWKTKTPGLGPVSALARNFFGTLFCFRERARPKSFRPNFGPVSALARKNSWVPLATWGDDIEKINLLRFRKWF